MFRALIEEKDKQLWSVQELQHKIILNVRKNLDLEIVASVATKAVSSPNSKHVSIYDDLYLYFRIYVCPMSNNAQKLQTDFVNRCEQAFVKFLTRYNRSFWIGTSDGRRKWSKLYIDGAELRVYMYKGSLQYQSDAQEYLSRLVDFVKEETRIRRKRKVKT